MNIQSAPDFVWIMRTFISLLSICLQMSHLFMGHIAPEPTSLMLVKSPECYITLVQCVLVFCSCNVLVLDDFNCSPTSFHHIVGNNWKPSVRNFHVLLL